MQDQPRPLLVAAAALAAAAPSLLAYNVAPSPTFLNQALAFAGWGAFVLVLASATRLVGAWRQAASVHAALVLLLLAALGSWAFGSLPMPLALSAVGTLLAAALLLQAGTAAAAGPDRAEVFAAFAWGWLVAGGLNLVLALVQVFAPDAPDGDWIAHSNIVGRAVGNLRQPNHLSSVLLWAAIAAVALIELRAIVWRRGAAVFAAMVFGVVLTASRTGLVSVGVLALWGLIDRRLAPRTRLLLGSAPLVYALAWWALAGWAEASGQAFGGAARLAETDVSGSRFGIWADTLALIRSHPWWGVGFGEFNLAWTLTPFPGRPTAFFDHTHNLPLQLAVEMGLPLATLVLALLLLALVQVLRRARSAPTPASLPSPVSALPWRPGDGNTARRAALAFVLMISLHSLLEYPLWYAYFLLPTAFAFGFGLGHAVPARGAGPPGRARAAASAPLAAAALLLVLGSAVALLDYRRVTAIFNPSEAGAPLELRIERGQRSLFFAHHADYAAATTEVDARLQQHAFDGAVHYLLDTRLMMAWAEALAERGDVDRARYLAARLREFRNPLAKDWFAACAQDVAPGEPRPFQCEPPQRPYRWQDFAGR